MMRWHHRQIHTSQPIVSALAFLRVEARFGKGSNQQVQAVARGRGKKTIETNFCVSKWSLTNEVWLCKQAAQQAIIKRSTNTAFKKTLEEEHQQQQQHLSRKKEGKRHTSLPLYQTHPITGLHKTKVFQKRIIETYTSSSSLSISLFDSAVV